MEGQGRGHLVKVINFFIHIVSVLVYLTVGSLLIIMSLRIVDIQDVITSIEGVYGSISGGAQTFLLGIIFIFVGLAFARILIKKGQVEDALIFRGTKGMVSISLSALEDVTRKSLKKFLLVKTSVVKCHIEDERLEILVRLTLWSTMNIPGVIRQIQEEIRVKILKLLGQEYDFEIKVDIESIEEHKKSVIDEETLTENLSS